MAFGGAPDLRTAAHEAAHVVQQRGGVQLSAGVGKTGDVYERHADAVADRVVQGRSAEDLLSAAAPPQGAWQGAFNMQRMVQCLGESLDKPLSEGAETPGHGAMDPATHNIEADNRGATDQRRYTVEQYLEMWEAERGRKMTDKEKTTLARGCIGIKPPTI